MPKHHGGYQDRKQDDFPKLKAWIKSRDPPYNQSGKIHIDCSNHGHWLRHVPEEVKNEIKVMERTPEKGEDSIMNR